MNALKKLKAICEASPQGDQHAYVNYCTAARTSLPALIAFCEALREEINAMKHLQRMERRQDADRRRSNDSTVEAKRRVKTAAAAVQTALIALEAVCA